MKRIIGFSILSGVKIFSHIFYRAEFKWITPSSKNSFERVRIIALLNHTSLFEPLYLRALSFGLLWKLSKLATVPGADITLNRPIVGKLWKLMIPNIASVSRKLDSTWTAYLKTIHSDSVVIIAPEGRMKRPNGLDKHGRLMSIKPGIVDIIESIDEGGMVLCFSGGLHHIQSPGQFIPKLFKTLKLNMAHLDIGEYKVQFSHLGPRERKLAMINDLQKRLEKDCPA